MEKTSQRKRLGETGDKTNTYSVCGDQQDVAADGLQG